MLKEDIASEKKLLAKLNKKLEERTGSYVGGGEDDRGRESTPYNMSNED